MMEGWEICHSAHTPLHCPIQEGGDDTPSTLPEQGVDRPYRDRVPRQDPTDAAALDTTAAEAILTDSTPPPGPPGGVHKRMIAMPRQTTFMKSGDITPAWHIADAQGQILGRISTRIATILMGKHRPEYTPHVDCGDFVIVTNAEKIVLTGRKAEQKSVLSYSGYPGGLRARSYGEILEKHPERLIENSVRRMLPKSRLGTAMLKKLKVYSGPDHPHAAQNPTPIAD